jgi:hypothetical protein
MGTLFFHKLQMRASKSIVVEPLGVVDGTMARMPFCQYTMYGIFPEY